MHAAMPPCHTGCTAQGKRALVSQWLYFQPGVRSVSASSRTRMPAAAAAATSASAAAATAARSASLLTIGTMTTCSGHVLYASLERQSRDVRNPVAMVYCVQCRRD